MHPRTVYTAAVLFDGKNIELVLPEDFEGFHTTLMDLFLKESTEPLSVGFSMLETLCVFERLAAELLELKKQIAAR